MPAALRNVVLATLLAAPGLAAQDSTSKRPMAIEYSDLYYTRLRIHQVGSYIMLPLAAGQYYLGEQLLNKTDPPKWVKGAHSAVALGLGVTFGANTVTGAWNLWDARHDPHGRARRYIHSALLVAGDVMFVLAATSAESAQDSPAGGNTHRNYALTGFSLSAAGTVMMWLWKD
jgi:hypothetical protein